MNLYKKDIERIGGTIYEENGFTCFICNVQTASIESLLLREILLLFGNYRITSEEDFMWDNGTIDIEMKTNLPYEIYIGQLKERRASE